MLPTTHLDRPIPNTGATVSPSIHVSQELLGAGFNPYSLFNSGEDGAFYDVSNTAALNQQLSGIVSAAAADSPVGTMLDIAQMGGAAPNTVIAAAAEIVENGTFEDTTGWSIDDAGSSIAAVGGKLEVSCGATNVAKAYCTIPTVDGQFYYASADVSDVSGAGYFQVRKADNATATSNAVAVTLSSTEGIGSATFKATSTTTYLVAQVNLENGVGYFDNVSVKAIPGNHATAAVLGDRPILRIAGGLHSLDNVSSDALAVTLADLGSDATEAIATLSGVTINTGQTIGAGARSILTDDMVAYLVIDRALTTAERLNLHAWMAAKSGATL